jgi:hypothetical protein
MSYTIPVRELTSRAAVLRIAAEVVESNLRDPIAARNYLYRIGCCAAFASLRVATVDAYDNGQIGLVAREETLRRIFDAQGEFAYIYRSHGARATKEDVFWMGTRSDMGQKRRITALLAAAEMVKD